MIYIIGFIFLCYRCCVTNYPNVTQVLCFFLVFLIQHCKHLCCRSCELHTVLPTLWCRYYFKVGILQLFDSAVVLPDTASVSHYSWLMLTLYSCRKLWTLTFPGMHRHCYSDEGERTSSEILEAWFMLSAFSYI